MVRKLIKLALVGGLVSVCACATAEGEAGWQDPPMVLGIFPGEIRVGQDVEIVGANFLTGSAGHTEIRLDGVYQTHAGPTHDVSLQLRPHWEDGNRMVWAHVGPFEVPFSPTGDELGVFHGTLTAINFDKESGIESESEPIPVDLEILPSVIIREFQPVTAECEKQSPIVLGGFAYIVHVKALGFTPVNFSYIIGGEPGAAGPRIIRREAQGLGDRIGEDGEIVFAPLVGDVPFYVATLAVASLGTDGNEYAIALNFGVHNPLEFISTNQVKIAEIEAPAPKSGCIAGGDTIGRTVTYSETDTDTRTRTVGLTWDETWLEQNTSTQGGSTTTTNGVSFDVNQSQTQGWEAGWENSNAYEGGANASFGLFDTVKIGFSGKYTRTNTEFGSYYGSNTKGYTVGRTYSESDTESWAFSRLEGHEVAVGTQDFWAVESSQSTVVSFEGYILPGEFGVFYRQTTRLALPGVIVAYNLCGIPEVVAEANFFDYTWSIELAQGNDCPPLPEPDLPDAQCFVAPCSTIP